jgi:hypothetical protein
MLDSTHKSRIERSYRTRTSNGDMRSNINTSELRAANGTYLSEVATVHV